MLRGIVATVWGWVVTIVVIVLVIYAIGWFNDNSAWAGTQVGATATSIWTFIRTAIGASPVG